MEPFLIQATTVGYEDIPDMDVKHMNMLPKEVCENLPCKKLFTICWGLSTAQIKDQGTEWLKITTFTCQCHPWPLKTQSDKGTLVMFLLRVDC